MAKFIIIDVFLFLVFVFAVVLIYLSFKERRENGLRKRTKSTTDKIH